MVKYNHEETVKLYRKVRNSRNIERPCYTMRSQWKTKETRP